MLLAACLGVKGCVIFGATSAGYFGYPENVDLRLNFCSGCWWIKETPRGFAQPVCTRAKSATIAETALQGNASGLDETLPGRARCRDR